MDLNLPFTVGDSQKQVVDIESLFVRRDHLPTLIYSGTTNKVRSLRGDAIFSARQNLWNPTNGRMGSSERLIGSGKLNKNFGS